MVRYLRCQPAIEHLLRAPSNPISEGSGPEKSLLASLIPVVILVRSPISAERAVGRLVSIYTMTYSKGQSNAVPLGRAPVRSLMERSRTLRFSKLPIADERVPEKKLFCKLKVVKSVS